MNFKKRAGKILVGILIFSLSFGNALTVFAANDGVMPSFLRQQAGIGQVVDPASQSGAFEYQVPINVPPGRNGMTPEVKLTYSSQHPSDHDVFGYGWEVSIPYIERYNKDGLGNMYSSTTKHFFSSLSGELVSTTSPAEEEGGGSSMMSMMGSFFGSAFDTVTDFVGSAMDSVAGVIASVFSSEEESGSNIASTTPEILTPPAIDSEQLKLKTSKDKLLGYKEYSDGTVKYAYKTDVEVEDIPASEKTISEAENNGLTITNEVVKKRTSYARIFSTNKKGVYVLEAVAGDPQYYKDENNEWWIANYGTTTKESYDYQLKSEEVSMLDSIIQFIAPKLAFAQTSSIFYPDPDTESATVDGRIYRYDGGANWDTIHDDTSGTNAYDNTNITYVQSATVAIERSIFLFDTSSIPDTDQLISATLSLYVSAKNNTANDGYDYFNVVQSSPASNTSLSVDDYDQVGSINSPTTGSSNKDIDTISTGAYTDFTLNSTGKAWVNQSGITKLGIREGHDLEDNATTGGEEVYVQIRTADYSGTDYDPKLVVVYGESSELGDEYVARNDDGSYLQYHFSSTTNSWIVKDKSGKTYLFGSSQSGRQDNISDSDQVYKWMLQKVTDTNGNTIIYNYTKNSGQIYPSSITYTGTATTTGIFSVDFSKSLRATSTATTTETGFEVKTRYKIDTVTVKVDGDTVHEYDLTYSTGNNGSRTLLSSITETGTTESGSSSIELPSTIFSYSTTSASWVASSTWSIPNDFAVDDQDKGISVTDVNGDNFADIVESYIPNGGSFTKAVYINEGTNWNQTASSTWSPSCPFMQYAGIGDNTDKGGRLVDVNGDLLPDFICDDDSTHLNTGNGWGATSTTWTSPEPIQSSGGDAGTRFADVNGDGLIDILKATSGSTRKVYLNNGSGWTHDSSWNIPLNFASGGGSLSPRLADVNGDGLVDIFVGTSSAIMLNTGSGWATSTDWTVPAGVEIDDTSVRFADFNSDGLVDIGWANGTTTVSHSFTWNSNRIYINNGSSGWYYNPSLSFPIPFKVDGDDTGARVVDVNGDGVVDIADRGMTVVSYPSDYYTVNEVDIGTGRKPDLLTTVSESSGKRITATYKNATLYQSGSYLNSSLPVNSSTLQKLEVFDGIGATSTLTYEYRDGKLYFGNPNDRRFAGFGTITRTDDEENVVKTYFHQGNYTATSSGEYDDDQSKIGRIYRTEVYDDDDNLFSLSINKWDLYNRGGPANFVKLASTTDLSYDGDGDHKDKAEEYTYDNSTGDVTQKVEWGEITGSTDGTFSDTGSDKRTTSITYAASSTDYLILPYSQVTKNQSNATTSAKRFYYDSQSLGSVLGGNLTKQESWVSGTYFIDSQKTYNYLGLVTQDTDPRSKVTTYSYDTNLLYPATSTNPLNQSTAYTYDYSSGKVAQTVDPNGNVFQTIFDALDRPSQEKHSDITTPSTLVTKSSYTYTDSGMPRTVQKTNNLNSATSTNVYTHIDGLGRKIEERSQAEGTNTYSVKDYDYDLRGLLSAESLPFFASSTFYTGTSSPASSLLLTTYLYDPLQRVTAIANSVGTTTNSYDQWSVSTTDANGKIKTTYKDAYDRLSRVDENNAGSTYTTEYEYDANNKLTKITDADDNERNFTYDGLGRRLTAQDLHDTGDGTFGTWTYAYDASGNIASTTDPKSQVVEYTYDDTNRVLTENYTGSGGTEVQYAYDWCARGIGKLCSATTTDVVTKNEYNTIGLVKKETKTINSTNYITQYDYDRLGNTTSIIYPDSSEVAYIYNIANLPEKIRQKESGGSFSDIISDLDYAPTGKVSYKLFGNGIESFYTYDPSSLYRLTHILTTGDLEGGDLGFSGGFHDLAKLYENSSVSESFTKLSLNALGRFTLGNSRLAQAESGEESVQDATENAETNIITNEPSIPGEETDTAQNTPEDTEQVSTTTKEVSSDTASTTEQTVETEDTASTTPEVQITNESLEAELTATTTEEVASTTPPTDNKPLPVDAEQLRLKTSKENFLGKKEFSDGVVKYAYKTETRVDDIGPSQKTITQAENSNLTLGTEIIDKRTKHSRTFATNNPNAFIAEIVAGDPQYYQDDNGEWWLADYGTTTKESYEYQTDSWEESLLERIFNFIFSSKVYAATGTFYPDPDTETATVDGRTYRYDAGGVWDTIHNDTVGTAALDSGTIAHAQSATVAIERAIFLFDTSSIPDDAYLSSSTLTLYVADRNTTQNDGYDYFNIVQSSPASNTSLSTEDYDQVGAVDFPTKGASDVDIDTITNNTYQDFILNSTGLSWINLSGVTKLGLREGHDMQDVPIGSSEEVYIGVRTADYSSTTYDPKLTVVYYNPPYGPADLLTESQTNPTGITDHTPELSAIYHDPDLTAVATHYRIQVATSSTYWGSPYWDSIKTTLASSTPPATRIAGISYSGTSLVPDTTYYWRIKFWNNNNAEGYWSTSTASFSLGAPNNGYLQDIYYTYDAVGNITRINDYSGTDAAKIAVFGYDDLYRLTSASTTAASSTPYRQYYSYSPIGNITALRTNSAATSSYSYAETNYANPHAATSIGGTSLTYDNNGNSLTFGSKSYAWDYRNRLASSTESGTNTLYTYDQGSQRVSKGNGVASTTYPSMYFDKEGTTVTRYIYANGEIVATISGNGSATSTTYTHSDHLSSTNVTSDSDGDLDSTLDYYPYGSERISEGSEQQKTYISQYRDTENSLSYLNARYLNSSTTKFLSEDPVHLAIGDDNQIKQLTGNNLQTHLTDPQLFNSYGYAKDNPIVNKDPTGNATYVQDNGVEIKGADIDNPNTYYEYRDKALVNYNATLGESNRWNLPMFVNQVKPGGKMDYSNAGSGNPDKRGFYFFNGKLVTSEEFGNLNYGYTGTAFGLGEDVLYTGAGGAQIFSSLLMNRNKGPSLTNIVGNFDDPIDTVNINTGINTYINSNRQNSSSVYANTSNVAYNASNLSSIVRGLSTILASLTKLVKSLK